MLRSNEEMIVEIIDIKRREEEINEDEDEVLEDEELKEERDGRLNGKIEWRIENGRLIVGVDMMIEKIKERKRKEEGGNEIKLKKIEGIKRNLKLRESWEDSKIGVDDGGGKLVGEEREKVLLEMIGEESRKVMEGKRKSGWSINWMKRKMKELRSLKRVWRKEEIVVRNGEKWGEMLERMMGREVLEKKDGIMSNKIEEENENKRGKKNGRKRIIGEEKEGEGIGDKEEMKSDEVNRWRNEKIEDEVMDIKEIIVLRSERIGMDGIGVVGEGKVGREE